jgi:hypothetical protein
MNKGKLDNISLKKLQTGKLICEICKGKINSMQYVYAIDNKYYHDCCSCGIKGRVKIL